eukprot:GHVS01073553.1.p1 GENE.GHVS01073553.1~~GHVS01073553.1.p1  ORF type:complete len:883 (-),score=122.48 GHVS01073553.1:274-2922(-)
MPFCGPSRYFCRTVICYQFATFVCDSPDGLRPSFFNITLLIVLSYLALTGRRALETQLRLQFIEAHRAAYRIHLLEQRISLVCHPPPPTTLEWLFDLLKEASSSIDYVRCCIEDDYPELGALLASGVSDVRGSLNQLGRIDSLLQVNLNAILGQSNSSYDKTLSDATKSFIRSNFSRPPGPVTPTTDRSAGSPTEELASPSERPIGRSHTCPAPPASAVPRPQSELESSPVIRRQMSAPAGDSSRNSISFMAAATCESVEPRLCGKGKRANSLQFDSVEPRSSLSSVGLEPSPNQTYLSSRSVTTSLCPLRLPVRTDPLAFTAGSPEQRRSRVDIRPCHSQLPGLRVRYGLVTSCGTRRLMAAALRELVTTERLAKDGDTEGEELESRRRSCDNGAVWMGPKELLPSEIKCIGVDWNLDLPLLDRTTGGQALLLVGLRVLEAYVDNFLMCGSAELLCFLVEIQSRYQSDNPYHNAVHGAEVCHSTLFLSNSLCAFDKLTNCEQVGLLVASLCHDVAHPGKNNAFQVASASELAMRYNDQSVLENFHSAETFNVLTNDKCNFTKGLPKDEYTRFRQCVIDLVLETDMSKHFESLAKFKVCRQSSEFSVGGKAEDRWHAIKMCIKAADIGHCSKSWTLHYRWASFCIEEFFMQGDEEVRLGLPVSPLCDRNKSDEIPKSQSGFLQFVCLDLFEELSRVEESAYAEECVFSHQSGVAASSYYRTPGGYHRHPPIAGPSCLLPSASTMSPSHGKRVSFADESNSTSICATTFSGGGFQDEEEEEYAVGEEAPPAISRVLGPVTTRSCPNNCSTHTPVTANSPSAPITPNRTALRTSCCEDEVGRGIRGGVVHRWCVEQLLDNKNLWQERADAVEAGRGNATNTTAA